MLSNNDQSQKKFYYFNGTSFEGTPIEKNGRYFAPDQRELSSDPDFLNALRYMNISQLPDLESVYNYFYSPNHNIKAPNIFEKHFVKVDRDRLANIKMSKQLLQSANLEYDPALHQVTSHEIYNVKKRRIATAEQDSIQSSQANVVDTSYSQMLEWVFQPSVNQEKEYFFMNGTVIKLHERDICRSFTHSSLINVRNANGTVELAEVFTAEQYLKMQKQAQEASMNLNQFKTYQEFNVAYHQFQRNLLAAREELLKQQQRTRQRYVDSYLEAKSKAESAESEAITHRQIAIKAASQISELQAQIAKLEKSRDAHLLKAKEFDHQKDQYVQQSLAHFQMINATSQSIYQTPITLHNGVALKSPYSNPRQGTYAVTTLDSNEETNQKNQPTL